MAQMSLLPDAAVSLGETKCIAGKNLILVVAYRLNGLMFRCRPAWLLHQTAMLRNDAPGWPEKRTRQRIDNDIHCLAGCSPHGRRR